eukprot:212189-Chlamydomonas_euryale.AAC.3
MSVQRDQTTGVQTTRPLCRRQRQRRKADAPWPRRSASHRSEAGLRGRGCGGVAARVRRTRLACLLAWARADEACLSQAAAPCVATPSTAAS